MVHFLVTLPYFILQCLTWLLRFHFFLPCLTFLLCFHLFFGTSLLLSFSMFSWAHLFRVMFYYAFLHCFAFLLFFHLLFSRRFTFLLCYPLFFFAASLPCYAFFFAASLPHLFSLALHFLNILSCTSLRRFTFELSFLCFPSMLRFLTLFSFVFTLFLLWLSFL
ncbi:hypothetical protein BCR41DRAFT_344610, partial [Lobosporangium transversale]